MRQGHLEVYTMSSHIVHGYHHQIGSVGYLPPVEEGFSEGRVHLGCALILFSVREERID